MSSKTIQLESKINSLYDYLYSNSSIRIPSKIAYEFGKILRAIAYLELHDTTKLNELSNQHFQTKNKTQNDTSKIIRASFYKSNQLYNYYPENEEIILSDANIEYVFITLSGVQISSSERDVFGDAMEIFRSQWTKSLGGQFFTDQHVTQLAIQLLQFNPLDGDDFVDICAGTGGFLIAALKRIRELTGPDTKMLNNLLKNNLLGQEIDSELANIANSTLSTISGLPQYQCVENLDSLQVFQSHSKIQFGKHSCVATNPPFGTKITIKDDSILNHFELAKSTFNQDMFGDNFKIHQRAPDILFIEQNVKLLKPGIGRLAIVVPYQIVSGPQTLYVRQWILKHTEVKAIVDLPPDTFQPHTGTKACLLILQRRIKPLSDINDMSNSPVFIATPKWIGHDRRGNPVYKRNPDGTLSTEILTDMPDVASEFQHYLKYQKVSNYSICKIIDSKQILLDTSMRLDSRFYMLKNNTNTSNKSKQLWEYVQLGSVVKDIFYPGRFVRSYVPNSERAVPFLGGTNISQLIINTSKYLNDNNKNINELKVSTGWILVTRSGTVGIVSSVPEAWNGYAISEHVIRIIPNYQKLHGAYLYAFLRSNLAQEIIARGVYGSVIDEITPDYLRTILVPIPKDQKMMDQIITTIQNGEMHRQLAVENLEKGVNLINHMLRE